MAQFGDVAVICADISQLRAPPSTPKITPPSAQPLRIIGTLCLIFALTLGGSCGLSWLESDAEDEARAAYAVTMRAHQTKYHVSEEDMDTLVELVGQPIECVTLLLLLSLIISKGCAKDGAAQA